MFKKLIAWFEKNERVTSLLHVLILILVLGVSFSIFLLNILPSAAPVETEFVEEASRITKTEYGVFNKNASVVYLATPEQLGISYCVVVAFDGVGVVYRYFDLENDAWAFYSLVRMLYLSTGKHEG